MHLNATFIIPSWIHLSSTAHNVFQNVIPMKKLSLINSHRLGNFCSSDLTLRMTTLLGMTQTHLYWIVVDVSPLYVHLFISSILSVRIHIQLTISFPSRRHRRRKKMKLSSNMLYISSSCSHINKFFLHFQEEKSFVLSSTHTALERAAPYNNLHKICNNMNELKRLMLVDIYSAYIMKKWKDLWLNLDFFYVQSIFN